MDHCVNCGLAATSSCIVPGRRPLDDERILSVVRQWLAPQSVSSSDYVCQECWNFAQSPQAHDQSRQVGHRNVCLRCGLSLLRRRSHLLHTGSTRESRIYNVIQEWIIPQTIPASSHICHTCWVAADRASVHMISGPSTSSQQDIPQVIQPQEQQQDIPQVIQPQEQQQDIPQLIQPQEQQQDIPQVIQPQEQQDIQQVIQPQEQHQNILQAIQLQEQQQDIPQVIQPQPIVSPNEGVISTMQPMPSIVLTEYMRAKESERRCFIEGCQRTERYRVPLSTRKMLFHQYKYYIPENNRLCDQHLVIEAWDFLDSLRSNYVQNFTEKHIYDMMSLKEVESTSLLDFENIDGMADHVVHIWTGLNKEQFNQMFSEVPQLCELSKPASSLAAYLMKLRTGESDERLASLLKVSRTTLEKRIHLVRNVLTDYFVPRNLGLNHINRQQLIERNLAIPKSLFGTFEGDDTPIIIFDGTYCYIEKSSNYLYQKKTYSLHKYRNLVKPFLIVCPDGYIIDVLGPYAATTSDAEIMKNEFQDGKPLRQYFLPGDAFVLDRGFRDSNRMLNQCGYRTYVPASLEEGETQLSTIEANKSRAVTICRWVVEVVNGRFKRDFKLLRQNYFNKASKSFIMDFEVAASLLNKFHPPIVDRVDAGEIIQEIDRYMNVENELAEFIISNNYNRRRANFETLTVHNDNLNDFPRLSESELILISLGTYQIKQARSYYGEHVRGNDGFVIEVCREVSSSLLRELSASNTSWLLRGRILSRHISKKTYFIYILVDSSRSSRDAILMHYCNCIVGRRTVGCCAHIMTVIWYLGWARYQDYIVPPAQFLDDILIIVEEE